METRALLNDDGTAAVSFGEPGQMAGFEVDWHEAVLTLNGTDGSLVRSITRTVGGQVVVSGPDPAPLASGHAEVNGSAATDVEIQHTPQPDGEHPADADASAPSATGTTGEGFAGFSQAADHAGEVKG